MEKRFRFDFIDALRGYAAFYVLIFHVVMVPHLAVPSCLQPFLGNGFTGVPLFFLISAFTLCHSVKQSQGEPNAIRRFYTRRIFRILPLYFMWLFVMLYFEVGKISLADFWLSVSLGFNLVPGKQDGIVWGSWSLSVEMLFYLFFPLLFQYTRNLKRAVCFLIFSFLVAIVHFFILNKTAVGASGTYTIFKGLVTYLPVFAAGIVCYYLFLKIRAKESAKAWGRWVVALAVIAFFLFPYFYSKNIYIICYGMTAIYATLFLGLSAMPIKTIVSRPFVYLGTISYSIYLNHPYVIAKIDPLFRRIYALAGNQTIALALCELLTLSLIVGLSMLTYRLVEKRGIEAGKKIIRKGSLLKELSLALNKRRWRGEYQ